MFRAEPIVFHRMLLNDAVRMQAYRDAVHACVRPGDVVLDVGSGSGILGLFACQAGAARVYSVEVSSMIAVARALATANGFGDRMRFLHGDAFEVAIGEPVDVIQSELISKAAIGENMSAIVTHCRDRFLKPDGRILPDEVALWVAPVDSGASWALTQLPHRDLYDIDFSAMQRLSDELPVSLRMTPDALMAEGQAAFRYRAHDPHPIDGFRTSHRFHLSRGARLHGFVSWFETRLAPGVMLSNAPPGTHSWDNVYFPLVRPIPVDAGDVVELQLAGRADRGSPLIWQWDTAVLQRDREVFRARQSSLHGSLLVQDRLRDAVKRGRRGAP